MLGSPASLMGRFLSLFLSYTGFVFASSLLCLLKRSAYLLKMSAPKLFPYGFKSTFRFSGFQLLPSQLLSS